MAHMEMEFVKMLVISAAVGGLVGIERERELKVEVVTGMRTFMLASIFGTLSVILSETFGGSFLLVAFGGIILVTILFGVVKNFKLGDIGVTTSVAFLATFLLGVLVGMGLYLDSIVASLIITGILVSKKYSQEFSESLSPEEIINALEFGLIAFVLYPLVPNEPIDPLNLINPRILILAVIAVASIGFAGFVALRRMGAAKGLPMVGALGGLINSGFTTSALSTRAGKKETLIPLTILGITLANAVMLGRNLVIAGLISFDVFRFMFLPQLAMIAVGISYVYPLKTKKKTKVELPFESPFAIMPAVRFALLFTLATILVSYLKGFGAGGVYLVSLLGGFASSAAVTASLASLAAIGAMSTTTAATACVIAAIGSTMGKVVIAKIAGSSSLMRALVKPTILTIILGSILLFLQS